jgi:exosortase/archaeosortase family protein
LSETEEGAVVKDRDFWIKFSLIFIGLYIFFLFADLNSLRYLVATASAGLLKLFGANFVLSGDTIMFGPARYVIVSSCTGVVGFSLFTALVAAAPLKRKTIYILAAFPLFVAWNVLRVTATVLWSDAHFWLWAATVAIVLVLFDWVVKKERVNL